MIILIGPLSGQIRKQKAKCRLTQSVTKNVYVEPNLQTEPVSCPLISVIVSTESFEHFYGA
jgi:hypothetical protein